MWTFQGGRIAAKWKGGKKVGTGVDLPGWQSSREMERLIFKKKKKKKKNCTEKENMGYI